MLRYLNQGSRPFGDHPMPVHKRLNWEFYAVLRGRLAPTFGAGDGLEFASDTMWVFPPNSAHGWVGEPGQQCEIVVFHFSAVPAELERRTRPGGCLTISLTADDKEKLQRIEAELRPHYWQPSPLGELHFERALMEISLLLLEKPASARAPSPSSLTAGRVNATEAGRLVPTTPALARVLAAENWFRDHLHQHPSLTTVACACGVSAAHLRRLFCVVRGVSPREIFGRIRMDQAMHLLAHSDRKLDDVATECGYACASQFCQAFKHRHGTTPTCWRRHAYTNYRQPAAHDAGCVSAVI